MPKTTLKTFLFTALLCVAGAAASLSADAAPCRDDKGKFIKCPPPAAAPAAKCRDMKTKKFAKCGTAGTEPVPAKADAKAAAP
jgi:hypothetical protein